MAYSYSPQWQKTNGSKLTPSILNNSNYKFLYQNFPKYLVEGHPQDTLNQACLRTKFTDSLKSKYAGQVGHFSLVTTSLSQWIQRIKTICFSQFNTFNSMFGVNCYSLPGGVVKCIELSYSSE
jgi:hypothetical protein